MEKDEWPSILQEVSFPLNNLPSPSTGYPTFAEMYGIEPERLSYFLNPTTRTRNDKVTSQCLEVATSSKGAANSKVNSNIGEPRSEMESNTKSCSSPTDVERGSMVFMRD